MSNAMQSNDVLYECEAVPNTASRTAQEAHKVRKDTWDVGSGLGHINPPFRPVTYREVLVCVQARNMLT